MPVRPDGGIASDALDGGGIRGLFALQMPDHVGDVGDLLLEVALVLLQAAKPFLAARKVSMSAEAWAPAEVSVAVHVHLLSQQRLLIHQIGQTGQFGRTHGAEPARPEVGITSDAS